LPCHLHMSHKPTHDQHVLKHIASGALAGLVEVLCMYPLDVVKTRFQLNTHAGRINATVLGTFRDVIRTEGFFNLYRGIISPICAEAPKRAVKFATNEQYKKLLADSNGKLSNLGYIAAGCFAGLTEAFINCPFELVKVRMQAKENLKLYKSTPSAAWMITKTEGPLVLYQGLGALLWRNGVWNGTYFGTINIVKQNIPEQKSYAANIGRNFIAGFLSGTLATILNTPFDVVKSRVQNTLPGQIRKYNYTIPSLFTIASEEGVMALYKGFVPKILRLGPGGGIMLVAFDLFSYLLS